MVDNFFNSLTLAGLVALGAVSASAVSEHFTGRPVSAKAASALPVPHDLPDDEALDAARGNAGADPAASTPVHDLPRVVVRGHVMRAPELVAQGEAATPPLGAATAASAGVP